MDGLSERRALWPTLLGLLFSASIALAGPEEEPCPTLWLDLGGKAQNTCLDIADAWPPARFRSQMPSWDPALYGKDGRYAGPAPKSTVLWDPVEKPAPLHRVGTVGDRTVYDVAYSPTDHVLLWDVGAGLFRPVLIIAGDPSIVAEIYPPERFRWRGSDLVHIRVQITGTGNLQDAVFLASVDGAVVPLRPDFQPLREALARQGLELFHRGGGFCEGSLSFQSAVEDRAGGRAGRVFADYAVRGHSLEPESIRVSLDSDDGPEAECELYPGRERRSTDAGG